MEKISMKISVTELAVHLEGGNLMFGDHLTRVRLEDDNEGYFVTLIQETENRGMQQVRLPFEEFDLVVHAVEQLRAIVAEIEE
jgi:hypothetical protein